MSLSYAQETHLGCYFKTSKNVTSYEIDIALEKNKLWINDYLYNITLATDLNIIALRNSDENERITINRYTGEATLDYLNKEEGFANNIDRFYCKKLEKLF